MAPVRIQLKRAMRGLVAAAAMTACSYSGSAQGATEYQVKAAYLFGFGRFVEWPASAPLTSSPAFVICVLGDDPFGRWLTDAVTGTPVHGKPVQVLHPASVDAAAACHVLFIGASEDVRIARILAALGPAPVLTVSDVPQFAERGGMIGFVLAGNRVRFTVNRLAAQAAGLTLNSELLRVAATVLQRAPGVVQ